MSDDGHEGSLSLNKKQRKSPSYYQFLSEV